MRRASLIVALLIACGPMPAAANGSPTGLAIMLRLEQGVTRYQILDNVVQVTDLDGVLRREHDRVGRNGHVAVLADEHVPIAAITELRAQLQAIGFSNVRYFYFAADATKMGELDLNLPSVPFSLEPWLAERSTD